MGSAAAANRTASKQHHLQQHPQHGRRQQHDESGHDHQPARPGPDGYARCCRRTAACAARTRPAPAERAAALAIIGRRRRRSWCSRNCCRSCTHPAALRCDKGGRHSQSSTRSAGQTVGSGRGHPHATGRATGGSANCRRHAGTSRRKSVACRRQARVARNISDHAFDLVFSDAGQGIAAGSPVTGRRGDAQPGQTNRTAAARCDRRSTAAADADSYPDDARRDRAGRDEARPRSIAEPDRQCAATARGFAIAGSAEATAAAISRHLTEPAIAGAGSTA